MIDYLTLLIVLKSVHVLSAALWIGSTVTISLVVKVVRSMAGGDDSAAISAELGRRLMPLTRASLYLTLVSGVLLALQRGFLAKALTLDLGYISVALTLLKLVLGASLLLMTHYHTSLGKVVARTGSGEKAVLRLKLMIVGWSAVAISMALAVLGTSLRFG
ncbi:MAG: hypothetical protein QXJ73_07965 [Candidatus Caldarchaeum sp.]